jgi:hypothetical protein
MSDNGLSTRTVAPEEAIEFHRRLMQLNAAVEQCRADEEAARSVLQSLRDRTRAAEKELRAYISIQSQPLPLFDQPAKPDLDETFPPLLSEEELARAFAEGSPRMPEPRPDGFGPAGGDQGTEDLPWDEPGPLAAGELPPESSPAPQTAPAEPQAGADRTAGRLGDLTYVTCWLPPGDLPGPAYTISDNDCDRCSDELHAYPEWFGRADDLTGACERAQITSRLRGYPASELDLIEIGGMCEWRRRQKERTDQPEWGHWWEGTLVVDGRDFRILYRPNYFGGGVDVFDFHSTPAGDLFAGGVYRGLPPGVTPQKGESLLAFVERACRAIVQQLTPSPATPKRPRRKKADASPAE